MARTYLRSAAARAREPKRIEARIEARVSFEQKQLITRAAEVEGVTVTDFVISSAHRAATRTIQEHQVLTLHDNDQRVFIDALLNPPEPSVALHRGMDRHSAMSKA